MTIKTTDAPSEACIEGNPDGSEARATLCLEAIRLLDQIEFFWPEYEDYRGLSDDQG